MKVLQLIDSLRPGGAEQMAVSYANALVKRIDGSYLCCTRKEGLLRKKLSGEVGYLFLNKKHSLDLQAWIKLRKFVRENRIDLVQAHGTSWFLATVLKLSHPELKLVWHDHYGKELQQRKTGLLSIFSKLFDGIISVNEGLKNWAEENLITIRIRYFRNFLPISEVTSHSSSLRGRKDCFKIICIANFRPQKDHLNLLRAFKNLLPEFPQVNLHLIGKVDQNSYSERIQRYIIDNDLHSKVIVYGEQEGVQGYLEGADLGVLSSASEGLPVALLEYGRAGLPVVSTAVGEVPAVVKGNGKLVPPGDPQALAAALQFYMKHQEKRKSDAENFQKIVQQQYSEKAVLPEVMNYFSEILKENVKGETVL